MNQIDRLLDKVNSIGGKRCVMSIIIYAAEKRMWELTAALWGRDMDNIVSYHNTAQEAVNEARRIESLYPNSGLENHIIVLSDKEEACVT